MTHTDRRQDSALLTLSETDRGQEAEPHGRSKPRGNPK